MLFVYNCERCEEQGIGHSYRVISEDDGGRLLDMMVCYGCYMEAAQLGLDTETIEIHQATLHWLMSRVPRQPGHND
jgi:hypothetical protein